MKTKSPSPTQSFSVGNLVFLRGGKSKNNPRELYIIEGEEGEFYLIRKFNNKLRDRLYRAHPDELIEAPSSAPQNYPEPSNKASPDPIPLLSKAGRPIREAAKKSHFPSVAAVTTKKSQFKPGWLPEDQIFDLEFVPSFIPDQDYSTTYEAVPHQLNHQLSTSDEDLDSSLTWDDSPIQYQLEKTMSSPLPLMQGSIDQHEDNPLPTHPPTRRFAISDPTLVRSNAFRHPPDLRPVVPQQYYPTRLFFNSRIPRPTSPSQVDLQQVVDISHLPIPPITPHNPPPKLNQQPRRNVKQPSNYKTYGETGRR